MRPQPLASPALLSVRNLEVRFASEHGMVPVVEDVSFDVAPGELVGLVGESGCGKSVTSLAVMRLIQQRAGRITAGQVLFEGRDLLAVAEREMQSVRGSRIAMVFQEPMVSLDPTFRVGEQIASTYRKHCGGSKQAAWDRALEMLNLVGIPHVRQRAKDYPHMFSGGMRQRVMIAIALVCGPSLLIADEPTTALDVTIQAQVLDLLRDLQVRLGMAVIFVTHDLGVVAELCARVMVMYAGQIVETGATDELFGAPRHPYTGGLLGCLPSEHVDTPLRPIPGVVPVATAMPSGCRFHPRCAFMESGRCDVGLVPLVEVGTSRLARCVRTHEIVLAGVEP